MNKSIQMNLFQYFLDDEQFTIKEATNLVNSVMKVNNESIRARIYEGVDKGIFTKISRGVYKVSSQINGKSNSCLLINGNGRDLSMIEDNSIDGIITDHPYDLNKALTGGNRNFATYELFKYNQKDFDEKQRVLKDGAFLVEFLPEESEINYQYLYSIKEMATKSGFKYFAKVPWKKGDFVANTGRKSKNIEDVMIFSKGEPRALKLDNKKNIEEARKNNINIKGMSSYEIRDTLVEHELNVHYMKGTNGMLPTMFDYQPRNKKEKVMEAEKPVGLLEDIICYISKPYEVLLDQFAGSGNFVVACFNKQRNSIAIEQNEELFQKMRNNIESQINETIDYEIERDI
ncbi:MAG: site-specific DNA-methyltransferase [Bacilli bacterium]|nr:site-specific DNA-methyltransferase [Bacilli bacterium]